MGRNVPSLEPAPAHSAGGTADGAGVYLNPTDASDGRVFILRGKSVFGMGNLTIRCWILLSV
jgi:hypothetical protein